MALNLVSNYAANVAHRNLTTSDNQMASSLAKLSSGTRVVSAKDDAAAMAIGSRISSEVAGLKQASVNAGQASSMLQIADGAMSNVSDILTRMKTLAVQASSDQVSNTERGMLDTEYQSLVREVDRIAESTQFNGNFLVKGSQATNTALSGSATNALDSSNGFASIDFGKNVGNAAFSVAYDDATKVLTVKNLSTGTSQGVDIGDTAIGQNKTQKVKFDQLDMSISLNSAFDKTTGIDPSATNSYTQSANVGATGVIETSSLRITSMTAGTERDVNDNPLGGDFLRALADLDVTIDSGTAAAAVISLGGINATATIDLSTTGEKTATFTDATTGDSITVAFNVATAFVDAEVADGDGAFTVGGIDQLAFGHLDEEGGTTDFTFKLGAGAATGVNGNAANNVTFSIDSITTNALGIGTTSVATAADADAALDAISGAIDQLNTSRANIGASQNRLEFASSNLATTIENQEAARSALLDLDVAAEMTKFTSKQVLMQAGVSMLAQANQMPQNLMRLLG